MQFSDTANKTGLIQYSEVLTGLGDAGISGNATLLKQFTTLINNWYNYVTTIIIQAQDDWDFDDLNNTDYPIGTINLVANQQDYSLPAPTTVLKIRRVEIMFNGSWYKAEPFSRFERGKATDTASIAADFDGTNPFYDMNSSSIFLYPIPQAAVTGGLKVFFVRAVTNFVSTDTTKIPGFDVIFHTILSLGASYEWSLSNDLGRSDRIKLLLDEQIERLKQHYSTKNRERESFVVKPAFISYD